MRKKRKKIGWDNIFSLVAFPTMIILVGICIRTLLIPAIIFVAIWYFACGVVAVINSMAQEEQEKLEEEAKDRGIEPPHGDSY